MNRATLLAAPLLLLALTACTPPPEPRPLLPAITTATPALPGTPNPPSTHPDPARPGPVTYATMARAVDGDTIDVLLEPDGATARIRILGIDTPERGQCGYRQATAATAALAPHGAQLALHRDPAQRDRDRYGRLLRYVALPTTPHVELSTAITDTGWAEHYDAYPVGLSPLIEAAETRARDARLGQWAPVAAGGCS